VTGGLTEAATGLFFAGGVLLLSPWAFQQNHQSIISHSLKINYMRA